MSTPYEIYCWVAGDSKKIYYIGVATDAERRYQEHLNGTGAKFAKKYKPNVLLCMSRYTGQPLFKPKHITYFSEEEAKDLENMVTRQFARYYGKNNVRGGSYCAVEDDTHITDQHLHEHEEKDSTRCLFCDYMELRMIGSRAHDTPTCHHWHNLINGKVPPLFEQNVLRIKQ